MQRRVDLAVAVAQERLLTTHVDHALRLIELAGTRVPFQSLLGIYTRLLRLSDEEARVITTRALATMGQRVSETEPLLDRPPAEELPEESQDTVRRSFFGTLRHRLRGRVNDELRQWIEFAAARTEVALLDTHVENGLQFVELLDDEMPVAEAVELYLDALDVRDSVAEVVYYFSLARLSDRFLPNQPGGTGEDLVTENGRRLRVVEKEGV